MVTGISEKHFIWAKSQGKRVEAFGPTMGIATAVIALGLAITTAVGKEKLGTHFEYAVAGHGDVYHAPITGDLESGSGRSSETDEKQKAPIHEEKEEKHDEKVHEELK